MAGFGAPYRALSKNAIEAAATPPSGHAQEAIWHQAYDTQLFTSGTTTRLVFFQALQADRTLSNMEQAGSFPKPQSLQIHQITCDVLSILPTTLTGDITGVLTDLALLIFGANERPTWTLNISNKNYGPYSLTTLHGTGGPAGSGWSGATITGMQYARNEPGPGWNYCGRVIIPEQVNFSVELNWAATATMTANKRIRLSLFGVLGRRVL